MNYEKAYEEVGDVITIVARIFGVEEDELYVQFLRCCDKFDPKRGKLRSFMNVVLRRQAYQILKKKKKRERVFLQVNNLPDRARHFSDIEWVDTEDFCSNCANNSRNKSILWDKIHFGKTNKELAQKYGIDQSTVINSLRSFKGEYLCKKAT